MRLYRIFLYILIAILAIVPLFWLKGNQINLGGDSSRLYFYQPWTIVENYVLYGINPWNTGQEMVGYFLLPFAAFLQLILFFVKTPHNLISVFNSLTFVVAFLGTYASIVTIILDTDRAPSKQEGWARVAGIIGGLFYIFAPTMTNWDKALLTFNQTFLDPLLFFLFYKCITTKKIFYGILGIIITFVFAPNFSFVGAPTFFSFYPIVALYITLQMILVFKKSIKVKQIVILTIIFLGVQAFQLVPQLYAFLNPTSIASQRVFSSDQFNYVDYFLRVVDGIKVGNNFLGLPQGDIPFAISFFIFPFLVLYSLMQKTDKRDIGLKKSHLLLTSVFLLLLFFISGKITYVGLFLYANFFRIPGFGMFRNFHGQFVTSFFFFYALLIGLSLYLLSKKIDIKKSISLLLILIIILLIRGWPLLNGSMLYLTVLQAKNNTASPFIMPKEFGQVIQYIKETPNDGKVLTLPLTDFGYQMLAGEHEGLYIGPSMIGQLALKKDFTGYDDMGIFGSMFLEGVKDKNIDLVKNILAILNVQQIFWEKNPTVYNENFPNFPYNTTKDYIPTTVNSYQTFFDMLPSLSKKLFGSHLVLANLDHPIILSKIFTSNNIIYSDNPINSPYELERNVTQTNVILPLSAYNPSLHHVTFEANNLDTLASLATNIQFHNAVPEVSWSPGSLVYPLVIWKEERTLKKLQGDDKFTVTYLDLAKRVEELHKWGNQTPILQRQIAWSNPKIWQVHTWQQYNSWEGIIAHYRFAANTLIANIHQSSSEVVPNEFIAMEQFEQHRQRINAIIDGLDIAESKRGYLYNLVNSTFNELEKNLDLKEVNFTTKYYNIMLPAEANGTYIFHVLNTGTATYSAVVVNNQEYPLQVANKDIFSSTKVELDGGKKIMLSLLTTPLNLASQSKWEGSAEVANITDGDILRFPGSNTSINQNELYQIPLIPSVQQYFISFAYKVNSSQFIVQLISDDKNDLGSLDINTYSTHTLQSGGWKLFQTTFSTSPKTLLAYLQLKNNSASILNLNIKNLTITPIEYPILTLEKSPSQISSVPKIFFQRVNPTKYKILVTNASDPYILTFLDAFSKNWKLYYNGNTSDKIKNVTTTYFNDMVEEGEHTNIFFNGKNLETWNLPSLPEIFHTQSFGYANAWTILPDQTKSKRSYEFILELQSQRSFYIGSFISVVFLSGISIWAIGYILYISLRDKKK